MMIHCNCMKKVFLFKTSSTLQDLDLRTNPFDVLRVRICSMRLGPQEVKVGDPQAPGTAVPDHLAVSVRAFLSGIYP